MGILQEYRFEILLAVVLVAGYFALRLTHILSLPIFTDEAIYIRWAQIAKNDASWRFISLTDGKQPMYVWFAILTLKVFRDPLLAGRMVSVVSGFFTMAGLFFVGKELFKNKWIGYISALLYVLFPFGLVYDRMALYDSMVGTFTVWALYVEILLVRKIKPELSFILGLVLGGGMLTKTSAFFSAALLPVSLLLFEWKGKYQDKLGRWTLYAGLSVILALLYYSILRLSPFYYIIGEKNDVFVYPIREWLHHPFTYFTGNFQGLFGWFVSYMTWPVILLIAASFVLGKQLREKLLVLAWFAAPFVYLAFFGRVIYPRFILFMVIPLLVLAAYTLWFMVGIAKKRVVWSLIAVCSLALFVYADFFILTNFPKAPIPQADIFQYSTGWPAGGGVKEAIAFFQSESQKGPLYVSTEGTFGLMPYGLQIFLSTNKNITIDSFWPVKDTLPQEVASAAKKMPTYVLFYQPCPSCNASGIAPKTWPLEQVMQFNKGDGNYLTVYRVIQ